MILVKIDVDRGKPNGLLALCSRSLMGSGRREAQGMDQANQIARLSDASETASRTGE